MTESPVLIHVWDADPAQEGVAIQHLGRMFDGVVADPGFVSASVLVAADGSSVAALVEMRSVEDRRRLERLPEVRETLEHLPGTVSLVLKLYHEARAYHA